MKYKVTALSIKCERGIFGTVKDVKIEETETWTNEQTGSCQAEYTRSEIIDTVKNPVFHGCKDEYEVENRYEEFWNRLKVIYARLYGYPKGICTYNNEHIVKVVNVIKIPTRKKKVKK